MKIKTLINIIGKTFFFLCVLLLTINFASNIKISFHYYFFLFWITYLISFLLLIFTSKHKFHWSIIGVVPIIISIYLSITDHRIGLRKNILDSPYEILAYQDSYQVVERHFIIEKVIAEKESRIFFNNYSKIGLILPWNFEVKIIDDNKNMIILDINTIRNGKTIDSLMKTKTTSTLVGNNYKVK